MQSHGKWLTAIYFPILYSGSNGRTTAAIATTTLTVRSTRLLEIDTATRAKTGLIRHAAGSFQNFPRPVLLLVLLPVRPLPPRLLVPRLVRLLLRLLPQPNQRTIRAASVREIVPATFFASCVSTRMNKWRSLITTLSNLSSDHIASVIQEKFSPKFEIDNCKYDLDYGVENSHRRIAAFQHCLH